MKFLFKSKGEAQAWKRMCPSSNSLAWAKEDAAIAAMWGDSVGGKDVSDKWSDN
jgi:hypothetical protein